jgi:hypothetical protein
MKENMYKKYLQQDTWFHGTTLLGWQEMCKLKVKCDYNRGNELDFGYGFYMTPTYAQAENYINRTQSFLEGDDRFQSY